MFVHNINPTLFKIGALEIRYYGIIFALGFLLAYLIIGKVASKKGVRLSKDDVADLVFYLILGTVIGARLFFVLYNLPYFIQNPLEIIAVWHGGLIFLGGFLGSITAVFIFSKKRNLRFIELADLAIIPLPLALAFGRIANFINSEFVGRITSVPWAVNFNNEVNSLGDLVYRHPVQLYESMALFTIFLIIWKLKDKKLKHGTLFCSFLVLYSIERCLLGFFKVADEKGFILGITVEQLTYIVTFIIGLLFLYKLNKKTK